MGKTITINLATFTCPNDIYSSILKKLFPNKAYDYMGAYLFQDSLCDWLIENAKTQKLTGLEFIHLKTLEKFEPNLSYQFMEGIYHQKNNALYYLSDKDRKAITAIRDFRLTFKP